MVTEWIIHLVSSFGYLGVIIAMAIESASIPLPSEVIMGIAGYLVGWRPSTGGAKIALGFIFLLFFGYALSWVGALVGLSAKDFRVVQNVSFLVTFPLTFLSNAFAPTTGMPKLLQYFAEWNPVSTMVAACRELFGVKNVFGATAGSFPSQHPLITSLLYIGLIMLIFVPLALRKYRKSVG